MASKKSQPEKQSNLEIAKEVSQKLFDLLGIDGSFEMTEGEGVFEMVLDTKDSGIVIGYHGEVLEALQLVLSLLISKRLDHFVRASIEVGDYKKNRTNYLENLAQKIKERAVEENREQTISSLKSWERRIVHLFLQDDPDVISESVGEGKERTLIVRPK